MEADHIDECSIAIDVVPVAKEVLRMKGRSDMPP
jgi:hypothetical protein